MDDENATYVPDPLYRLKQDARMAIQQIAINLRYAAQQAEAASERFQRLEVAGKLDADAVWHIEETIAALYLEVTENAIDETNMGDLARWPLLEYRVIGVPSKAVREALTTLAEQIEEQQQDGNTSE